MTKAMIPDGDTINYAYFEGKGIRPGELIDLAETMPFCRAPADRGGEFRVFQECSSGAGGLYQGDAGYGLFPLHRVKWTSGEAF